MKEQDIHLYWKEIMNTLNDAIMVISPDGGIVMVNSAMERVSGYTAGELSGQSCAIFRCDVCEVARSEAKGNWCRLFDQGGSNRKRCLITRKNGTYAPVFKSAALLRDADGQVLGAVETLTDVSELDSRDQQIQLLSRIVDTGTGFHGLIGKSPAMQRIYQIIEKAAQSDAPIIIYGASGTGKELVARAIHEVGRRKEGPYITVNCAALNESLLESELFGHVKGAFTGAYRHRQGRFEAANNGDILLDEIGDVPLGIQVKLLRVLETKQFERVGDHESLSADARVIAATNRNLGQLVLERKFREDLYFRINVIPLHLPPLKERMEDIPLLVSNFINNLRLRSGKEITGLSAQSMRLFMKYSWPGNVRELKSALEYAFVIAEHGHIEPEHLPSDISGNIDLQCVSQSLPADQISAEKSELMAALKESGGNQSVAARKLGISRVTVWNRMRKHGIDLKKIVQDYPPPN